MTINETFRTLNVITWRSYIFRLVAKIIEYGSIYLYQKNITGIIFEEAYLVLDLAEGIPHFQKDWLQEPVPDV